MYYIKTNFSLFFFQRHCRLKHNGDIRVVSNKNGQEKIEVEELTDEPDHVDVVQEGTFKCTHCPFSNDDSQEFDQHRLGHLPNSESIHKCAYCKFFVSNKEDLLIHLTLHGISDPDAYLIKLNDKNNQDGEGKKFRCAICPYVTNSKSQYTYHKQFHKPRGGQYNCNHCSYNVTKRHLLHQHLKVHGINVTSHKQNGETISLDEITDEIEEVPSTPLQMDLQHFPDIPLVWVSKNGKFSKMFKCRYCPHVNLRKVNIQEHEKMHSTREKNPNSTRINDIEHRCTECNYVCNNAGVLSSHSKVHQGLYGIVHSLVDPTRTDEEQIKELSKAIGVQAVQENGTNDEYEFIDHQITEVEEIDSSSGTGSVLYFCKDCPARFLKENEFGIHKRFHGLRLFYKCDYCTYTSREKPHLLSHFKVHTSDYQKRTKELQKMYITSANYPQPNTYISGTSNGEPMWIVAENNTNNKTGSKMEMSTLCSILNKPVKSSINVPLSGTDLFLQKSEAQQKHQAEMIKEPSPPPQIQIEIDPEHAKGNPKFIYPTTIKNGRMKEKRYKCHKCPSAFEKKEQYKLHLSLHGSKQRYLCEFCDYSVTNYANYIQHLKKHKLNNEAHARRSSDEMEDPEEALDNEKSGVTQTKENEEKKLLWCLYCPYTSTRKDAVDNHQKRHICVSGVENTYNCEHCDYSVPQGHILREHTKCHFGWNNKREKMFQLEGYMSGEIFKLTSNSVDEVKEEKEDDENVIFDEDASKHFLPAISAEVAEKFNNNEGEKHYVNVQTGEVVVKKKTSDMQSSNSNNNTGEGCEMEVN